MKNIKCLVLSVYTCYAILSCAREGTCEEAANNLRSDDCSIVVEKIGSPFFQFSLKGFDPKTKAKAKFERVNYSWSFQFADKIAPGDTVFKHKGELKFYIHKKNTLLVFPFECKGRTYE